MEPDLAAMQTEKKELETACDRLLQLQLQNYRSHTLEPASDQTKALVAELEAVRQRITTKSLADSFQLGVMNASQGMGYSEWNEAVGLSDTLFKYMDKDSNGKVSWQEFVQADKLRKQFVALKMKVEVLSKTILQYQPDQHAPECIAEGGQGLILVGKDLSTGQRVAIKVERVIEGRESALQLEFNVLYALQDDQSFPGILHFGRQMLNSCPGSTECRVMVMDLLGASISDLWWETTRGTRGLSAGSALALAVHMLQLIEKLHCKGFIHRDLKPANFVMSGCGGRGSGNLCLIDFGISVPFQKELEKHKTKEMSSSSSLWEKQFFGTCPYASINAHDGVAQSYRDDLESLVYVFAFLLNGGLPWAEGSQTDADKVGVIKRRTRDAIVSHSLDTNSEYVRELCGPQRAAGTVIKELLTYCQTLRFDERPDYGYCKTLLMKAYSAETGRAHMDPLEDLEWNRPHNAGTSTSVDFMDLM